MGQITRIDLRNNNATSRFSGTGVANTTRNDGGPNEATFAAAVDCVADNFGNIYVLDSLPSTSPYYVRKVGPDGFVSTFLTLDYTKPNSVALDISGTLLFTTQAKYVYKRLDNSSATSLGTFTNPGSVVSDSFGNLFITDTTPDLLYWIDTQGISRNLTPRLLTAIQQMLDSANRGKQPLIQRVDYL
jgi:streptogramin lyase